MSDLRLLLILFAFLFGLLSFSLGRRFWQKRKLRSRFRRARRKEAEAARFLTKKGFEVLSEQVETTYQFLCDRNVQVVTLRADYLVSRRGKLFIAEVKSGKKAPDSMTRATRRQLLEYHLAYQVDGILLVDMEEKQIKKISFPMKSRKNYGFLFGILCGVFCSVIFWFLRGL